MDSNLATAEQALLGKPKDIASFICSLRNRAHWHKKISFWLLSMAALLVIGGSSLIILYATEIAKKDFHVTDKQSAESRSERAEQQKRVEEMEIRKWSLADHRLGQEKLIAERKDSRIAAEKLLASTQQELQLFDRPKEEATARTEFEQQLKDRQKSLEDIERRLESTRQEIESSTKIKGPDSSGLRQRHIGNLLEEIGRLELSLNANNREIETIQTTLRLGAPITDKVDQKLRYIQERVISQREMIKSINSDIETLTARLQEIIKETNEVLTVLADAHVNLDQLTPKEGIWFLVTTNLTRLFGIVAFLFVGHHFIAAYRYQSRMAAFYDSRADFLEMLACNDSPYGSRVDRAKLPRLLQLWSPNKIGFVPEPSFPFPDISPIAGAISGKRR